MASIAEGESGQAKIYSNRVIFMGYLFNGSGTLNDHFPPDPTNPHHHEKIKSVNK